jgi:hypothetical protein
MIRGILSFLGALAACALVITGLYFWHGADDWALDWGATRPDLAAWSVRCAGIGMIAAAQAIFIPTAVWSFYRRGKADSVLAISATGLFVLTCAAAVAFNFAGR